MTPEQKQRAMQMLRRFSQTTPMTRTADNAAVAMAALLQDLVDAPEPEPVARVTGVYGGHTTVAPIDAAQVLRVGMALYTAVEPTPEPFGWTVCAETDDGAIALFDAPPAPTPAEAPADVARDAERLDWLLRNLPGDALRYCVGVLSDTSDGKEFREAIDAAIERQGGKVE